MKPLIGISCCSKPFGQFAMPNHAASDTYVRAVDRLVDGVPILFFYYWESSEIYTLLSRLDGIILTGSRSNVRPDFYGGCPHPEDVPEDAMRDAVTLPLIRAALGAGLPVLAICRGMQELNVALGGTLHQRLQDLPGRLDHSTPMQPDPRVRQGKAHRVDLVPGGVLHRLAGAPAIAVNSLHNQGVDRLAPGLVVEAVAPDGTVEAVRAAAGAGFAVGVQWHPEYDFDTDPASAALFAAFGESLRRGAGGELLAAD